MDDRIAPQRSPDDFCRTCRGTGLLSDLEDRDGRMVTVTQDCWACHGTGWGK